MYGLIDFVVLGDVNRVIPELPLLHCELEPYPTTTSTDVEDGPVSVQLTVAAMVETAAW